MAIIVTIPISAPTGLSATLQIGESLSPNTTYYYTIAAFPSKYVTALNNGTELRGMHSELSSEGTFTTTGTELSALITWTNSIEHDSATVYDIYITTIDKSITGNEYTTSRIIDSNGLIDTYYVHSYKINLAPDNTIVNSRCKNVIFTNYYPFTITLSKARYADYNIILNELLEKTELIIKYGSNIGELPNKPEFKFITHKKNSWGIKPLIIYK